MLCTGTSLLVWNALCIVYNVHYTMYNVHCTLYSVYNVLTVFNEHSLLHTKYIVHNVHNNNIIVHCTHYTLYTMYIATWVIMLNLKNTVQCTVYNM